jgi:hypothetical protein
MTALYVIVEPGGSWFGPYGSRELAAERRERLRRDGDSLGVRLAAGARILPARYTPDGIAWNWNAPARVLGGAS